MVEIWRTRYIYVERIWTTPDKTVRKLIRVKRLDEGRVLWALCPPVLAMQCYPLHVTLHCTSIIEKGMAQIKTAGPRKTSRAASDRSATSRKSFRFIRNLDFKGREVLTSVANLRSGYCGDSCYPPSLSFRANVNISLPTKAFHATALPSTGKKASITSPTAIFWYTMYPIVQDHMKFKTSSPNNKPLNKKQL